MKLLIDMNLSPEWVTLLSESGWQTVHWSSVGAQNAPDREICSYAKTEGYVILTHDLDFGTILAATRADFPSVLQIRTLDTTPAHLGEILIAALRRFEPQLERGALVTVDEKKLRARVLPL